MYFINMDILWKCIYTFEYEPSKLGHGNKHFLEFEFLKFMTTLISEFFNNVENLRSQCL
jgi:hypothetical protein